MQTYPERPLTLPDVIDLELKLAADRESSIAMLRRRDAQIAGRLRAAGIDPAKTTGPRLFLAWLDELRDMEGIRLAATAGRQTQRMLRATAVLLGVGGLILGLSVVGTWLLSSGGKPVNVIAFLPAVIGLQLPLLMLWLVAILPKSWVRVLPGAEAVFWFWRQLAQWLPRLVAWLVGRFSHDLQMHIERVRGELARWSWIYGSLRMWVLVRLTQVFALAFNLGLILGFVFISYGSDPAIGWKSALLANRQVHYATRVIAKPWSWLPGEWTTMPTLRDVRATHDWTLVDQYVRGPEDPWVRWWPFVFATLVCYGLLPRVVTLLVAHVQVRRSLRAIRLDHSEFGELAERLARQQIDTRAPHAEYPFLPLRAEDKDGDGQQMPLVGGGPIALLVWAGVRLPAEELQELVSARLGGSIVGSQHVGNLDSLTDVNATVEVVRQLEAIEAGRVALVVEAWEPPVADYVDFLETLRSKLGPHRSICVLLYDCSAAGRPTVARAAATPMRRRRLTQLGDPWLRVESLLETVPAPAAASTPAATPALAPGDQP